MMPEFLPQADPHCSRARAGAPGADGPRIAAFAAALPDALRTAYEFLTLHAALALLARPRARWLANR